MIYDTKDTEEEASLGHKGELLSSNLSEISDEKDEDDGGNGAKDKNCIGDGVSNGAGGGDRNISSRGRYAEWLMFLSPRAQT